MTSTVQQFDFSVDLMQTLLWRYDNAPSLRALIEQKQAWYDLNQQQFWENWRRDVFDLLTANDFGLAVWAKILDVPLVVGIEGSGTRPVFGFDPFGRNFFNGTFGRDNAGVLNLTTEQKRLLLRLRFFQLTTRATVPEINAFMSILFGGMGLVYVLDGLDMSAVYVFTFAPPPDVLFVLQSYDLLPRPAGVEVTISVQPGSGFGFAPYYENFENGNFHGA